MTIRTGHGVAPGRRVGTGVWLGARTDPRAAGTVPEELLRLDALLADTASRLETTRAGLLDAGALEAADVVAANIEMLGDPGLRVEARRRVQAGAAAPAAFAAAAEHFALLLEAAPDPLIASRATDLRRLGASADLALPADLGGTDVILLGADLGPADLAAAPCDGIAGIVMQAGGALSHAAIVASSLGVPLVVGLGDGLERLHGRTLLVDGALGLVQIDPPDALIASAAEELAQRRAADVGARDLVAVTSDGTRVQVFANAATPEEIRAGLRAGAEGIGLYRTELQFLDATAWPAEAAHDAVLRAAVAAAAGLPLTVRTLDFGGDKLPPFVDRSAASFLGLRGIRAALAAPGALEAQLRACAAVAGDGADVRILLPMVTTVAEVHAARALLPAGGAATPLGVMVEVPAAALLADVFAAESDFLSIGTNDLVQYTLAADRTLGDVADLVSPFEPAVVRLVNAVVRAADRHGTPVDVCGEAAAEPRFLALLVGMGVDAVSVAPSRVGAVKRAIRALDTERCGKALAQALDAPNRADVEVSVSWVEPNP